MFTEGFVKLPRSMLEWQWLNDGNTLRVYVVLLLLANWKDTGWHGIALKRGQLITSVKSLCERCHLTNQQVRTALSHLTSTNEITIKKTSKFSLVTLNNYDLPEEINNESNNVSTTCQQGNNNVLTTAEESKEEKEIKEKKEDEAASPLHPSFPVDNSQSTQIPQRTPNDNPVTREELVEKYGEENVGIYTRKFELWASRRGIKGVNMLGTIAKWLAEDGVRAGLSPSIDRRSVMCTLLHKYSEAVDTDGEK